VRGARKADGFFESDSRLVKCFSCCSVTDYQKYFDVTTDQVIQRLRFAIMGHFSGAQREKQLGQNGLDYDLYVPLWMMITLIVECSIVGYFN
jgi:hypothetical protein